MITYKLNIITIIALFIVGCGELFKPYEDESFSATLSVNTGCQLLKTDSLKVEKSIVDISDSSLVEYSDTLEIIHSDSISVLYTDIENNWKFTAERDTVILGLFISSNQNISFYLNQTSQINIYDVDGVLIEHISENIELETIASCPAIKSVYEYQDLVGSYLISIMPMTTGVVSIAAVME